MTDINLNIYFSIAWEHSYNGPMFLNVFVHSLENNHQTRCTLPRPWARFLSCKPGPSSAPSCLAPRGLPRPGAPARIAPFLYTTARCHSLSLTRSFCKLLITINYDSFFIFIIGVKTLCILLMLFVLIWVKCERFKRVCVSNRGLALSTDAGKTGAGGLCISDHTP